MVEPKLIIRSRSGVKKRRLFTATYGVENNQGKKQYGQELTGMLGIEDSREYLRIACV
ncbi:MAG: hypothetical protein V8R91_14020 [Butyricimonas faecihominis]